MLNFVLQKSILSEIKQNNSMNKKVLQSTIPTRKKRKASMEKQLRSAKTKSGTKSNCFKALISRQLKKSPFETFHLTNQKKINISM